MLRRHEADRRGPYVDFVLSSSGELVQPNHLLGEIVSHASAGPRRGSIPSHGHGRQWPNPITCSGVSPPLQNEDAASRAAAATEGSASTRIVPGTIDTPMLGRDLEPMSIDQRQGLVERVKRADASGPIGRPEEVADAAVVFASKRARHITGSCLHADGGFLAVEGI
jgi:hypothetical protein